MAFRFETALTRLYSSRCACGGTGRSERNLRCEDEGDFSVFLVGSEGLNYRVLEALREILGGLSNHVPFRALRRAVPILRKGLIEARDGRRERDRPLSVSCNHASSSHEEKIALSNLFTEDSLFSFARPAARSPNLRGQCQWQTTSVLPHRTTVPREPGLRSTQAGKIARETHQIHAT